MAAWFQNAPLQTLETHKQPKRGAFQHLRVKYFYLRRHTAGSVARMEACDWFPAMSSCLEGPYLGSTQLHPQVRSHWADAVTSINLPGWVLLYVLTAKTPHPDPTLTSVPNPTAAVEGWKSCQSFHLLWLRCHLGPVVIMDNSLLTMANPLCTATLHSPLSGRNVWTGVQTGVVLCVLRSVETGWRGWGGGQKHFRIWLLTTKYPGAVSGTNSNKSFSNGTVVNRVFSMAPWEERKAPSACGLQMSFCVEAIYKKQRHLFFLVLFFKFNFLIFYKESRFTSLSNHNQKQSKPSDCFDPGLACVRVINSSSWGNRKPGWCKIRRSSLIRVWITWTLGSSLVSPFCSRRLREESASPPLFLWEKKLICFER